jgi:hypothetical protein
MDDPTGKVLKLSAGVETTTTTFSSPGYIAYFHPDADQRAWFIIAYEVWMYFGTRSKMIEPAAHDQILKNATVESAIVHARILCDIFRSQGGDIFLKDLFSDWESDSARLRDLKSKVKDLHRAYGDSQTAGSPYQVFHQKTLHADQARYPTFQGFDYADQLKVLDPVIRGIVDAIEAIRGPLPTPVQ